MAKTKTQTGIAAKTVVAKLQRPITAKQFARLKPSTRRVKIAEDVLATLAKPRSRPIVERGRYCAMLSAETYNAFNPSTELQSILPTVQKKCHVCAMGALFLSHVRINNSFRLSDSQWGDSFSLPSFRITDAMEDYFPAADLREIEQAFEQSEGCGEPWGEAYPDPVKRLRAICRNIIRNKGDFYYEDVR